MRIALVGQNEDRTVEVMVEGESGLIAVSPPWFKARFEAGRVIWPNGAQAFVYTPEVPASSSAPSITLGGRASFTCGRTPSARRRSRT
jgi:phage terminase large subunit-like protein